jgi:hypothetical protein
MFDEIIRLLYRISGLAGWVKPIPPVSAAKLKTQSTVAVAARQFS